MPPYRSPWLTEELDIYRDSVRKFIEQEFVPQDEQWQKQQYVDRSAWRQAGEMGLLLTDVPEHYGGLGGSFAHEVVVYDELARAKVNSFNNAVHSIAAHYLLEYGSEEQKQTWLPAMVRGEMIGAIAMSEPGAGSDLKGVRTRAVRDGDDYIVNGSKIFISNGYLADLLLLVAKTDPGQGSRGISLLMVDTRDLKGYKVGRILNKIGLKGQDTAELFFDDVRVPAANLLGPAEGQGFYQLMQQLPYERLIIAVNAVASLERALELTVEYAQERKAFGQSIMEFQNTRFTLAEAKTEAMIARVFLDYCIGRLIEGDLDTVTASMAKWWTTEKQCQITDACLQLHGGYGYMLEYPIAQYFADSRVQKIYGGTNEIMKELIARSL